MLAIKEWCLCSRDEELRAVRVLACVCHGQHALGVLHVEVFILELATIDGLATSAIAAVKVATLDDKVLDDAVEEEALVAKPLLARSCKRNFAWCSRGATFMLPSACVQPLRLWKLMM
jgi:hypothetical protein